jgi:uncharacterized protein (TIGR03435 family)
MYSQSSVALPPVTAFEVASVKANHSGDRNIGMFPTPGRLVVRNHTLRLLVKAAYHLKDYQLFGTSGWMETDSYDIDAKADGKTTFAQDMPMLQALLTDRFQLKVHRETREIPVYVLVVGKGGPKLEASKDDDSKPTSLKNRPDGFNAVKLNFAQMAPLLSGNLNVPVIDETGIKGMYDVDLSYTPQALLDNPEYVGGISVFAAVQDQLGLKLLPSKRPVEVMVVDRAEKPAEN